MQPEVIVVSGIPRSGTSLMMQILAAGGMPVISDEQRPADLHNPRGYFECERVKNLAVDNTWIGDCRGKAVKVVSGVLEHLPLSESYKVIFMERSLDEVVASQEEMLGNLAPPEKRERQELRASLENHLKDVKHRVLPRLNAQALHVSHRAVLVSPSGIAAQLAIFLERELRLDAMTACVEENLYRQRQIFLASR